MPAAVLLAALTLGATAAALGAAPANAASRVYAARTPARRWVRFTGYIMLIWALALTESNGGVLALGSGITLLLMVKYYRRHGWAAAIATLLIICVTVGTFF